MPKDGKKHSKKNIKIPKIIKETWDQIQEPDNPTNWMLCTVKGGLRKKLTIAATGPGGHPHFQHLLKDDSIFFGGFKTTLYDEKGDTTAVYSRYLFFLFAGGAVAGFKRAKIVPLFSEVSEKFSNCALKQQFLDKAGFTTDALESRLANIIHGKVKYDWTNGMAVGQITLGEDTAPPPPPQNKDMSFKKKTTNTTSSSSSSVKTASKASSVKTASEACAKRAAETITIKAKIPNGEIVEIKCKPNDLVSVLKREIGKHEKCDIDPKNMVLAFKDANLADTANLKDLAIIEDSMVCVSEPFGVKVRLPTKKTVRLSIDPAMTTSELKKLLSEKHAMEIDPKNMRLLYKKKPLDDDKGIKEQGVKNGGLILMKGPFYVVVIMPDGKEVTVVCTNSKPAKLVCESLGKTEDVNTGSIQLLFRGKKLDLKKSLKDARIFSGDKLEAKIQEATRVAFLVSTYGDAYGSVQNIVKIILDGFKIKYELVDGALPEYRERRNELWLISGKKGVYPQLFVDNRFIGSKDEITDLNETGELQEIIGPIQSDPTQVQVVAMKSGRFNW